MQADGPDPATLRISTVVSPQVIGLSSDPFTGTAIPLDPGAPALWIFRRSELEPHLSALSALLAEDERERGNRLVREEHRTEFMLFHGMLRLLLGRHAGVDPAALDFARGARGRPKIVAPGSATHLDFNLTDAPGVMALAVAADGRVGVDIERIDRTVDARAVAERFFHPDERRALAALPEAARRDRFLDLWTAKEAWLKYDGRGIGELLGRLDFSAWTDQPCVRAATAAETPVLCWRFRRAGAWVGTLVARMPVTAIRYRP